MVEQQQMAEQLVRAGRLAALGELVAGIAHEIKNPLHTIKGTAEIVDEAIAEDAEQAPMWTLLRQEVERLERIAERFLSFARPQTPVLVAQPLAQAYDRVRELLEARVYESQGVRFEVAPLSSALAESELRVDRDQLAQLALNIAANAIRAMEGQGRLRLAVTPRDAGEGEDRGPPQVALTLENDGPTIPAEQLERIFDPFWTRAGDGTGLGLAIAERIAEAHGGTIEAHNTGDERGVAFSLVLPVSRAR
jgi:two-component system sensor histidine kinase HydH